MQHQKGTQLHDSELSITMQRINENLYNLD